MTFLIRRPGDRWRQPSTTSYDDEAALQALLEASPDLLPIDEPIAIVREFWVPTVGSVDLVGIGQSGLVVIVECKLRANPQIRREVVGQALAYAGGIWRMEPDDFFAELEVKSQTPLDDLIHTLGADDASDVRRALSESLNAGDFRIVIAVDDITPELRNIVEYLNARTAGFEIVALELAYSRQDDIEILVPEVYGLETADAKRSAATSSRRRWGVAEVEAAFEASSIAALEPLGQRLIDHGKTHGARFGGGTGKNPAISCYYLIDGAETSCWALYVGDDNPRVAISLGSVRARSESKAAQYLDGLRQAPGFASLAKLGPEDLTKYPTVPLADLDETTVEALLATVDLIRDDDAAPSSPP